jgi:hypothetical protein
MQKLLTVSDEGEEETRLGDCVAGNLWTWKDQTTVTRAQALGKSHEPESRSVEPHTAQERGT